MDGYTQRASKSSGGDHESASKMMEEPAPAKGGGWRVDSVNVRQAKNGGFIVSCSKSRDHQGKNDNQPTYQSNDYAFSTLDEVSAYLAQEFGASEPGGTMGGGGTGAAPMPMRGMA